MGRVRARTLIIASLLAGAACGRTSDPSGAQNAAGASGDGGTSSGAGGAPSSDAGVAGTVHGAGDSALGAAGGMPAAGSGGDAGGAEAGSSGHPASAGSGGGPSDEASKQQVTFRVTNDSGADRYLVGQSMNCTAYGLATAGNELGLQLANSCPACAACPIQSPGVQRLNLLSPGASVDIVWDGRSVTAITGSATCGGMTRPYVYGVTAPVSAGTHQVTIGVFASLPQGCNNIGACNPALKSQASTTSYATICDSEAPVTAHFDLPPTGDIVVPVSVK